MSGAMSPRVAGRESSGISVSQQSLGAASVSASPPATSRAEKALEREIVEERQMRFQATSEIWAELNTLKGDIKRLTKGEPPRSRLRPARFGSVPREASSPASTGNLHREDSRESSVSFVREFTPRESSLQDKARTIPVDQFGLQGAVDQLQRLFDQQRKDFLAIARQVEAQQQQLSSNARQVADLKASVGLQSASFGQQVGSMKSDLNRQLGDTLEVFKRSQIAVDMQMEDLRGKMKDNGSPSSMKKRNAGGSLMSFSPPIPEGSTDAWALPSALGMSQDKFSKLEEEVSSLNKQISEVHSLLPRQVVKTSRLAILSPEMSPDERRQALSVLDSKERILCRGGKLKDPTDIWEKQSNASSSVAL